MLQALLSFIGESRNPRGGLGNGGEGLGNGGEEELLTCTSFMPRYSSQEYCRSGESRNPWEVSETAATENFLLASCHDSRLANQFGMRLFKHGLQGSQSRDRKEHPKPNI